MPAESLQIELDSYHVIIGDVQAVLRHCLATRTYAAFVVICDTNTYEHCWPRLRLFPFPTEPHLIRIPAGELHKNIETCQGIWSKMMQLRLGRNTLVLNLGGGVVGDMGGFCAATYKRGVHFVQIPTTLLSQVDASVGGKLGIDFEGVKNSVGVFSDPQAVLIDPNFLATLPPKELRSGFAEMLKHALIADAEIWRNLSEVKELSAFDWASHIADSVRIKQRVVQADPYESGLRKILNFGHTIGHAVESDVLRTEQPLLHGEAIAVGMIAEAYLSHLKNGLSKTALEEITDTLRRIYRPAPIPPTRYPVLLEYMQNDKKNENTEINFSLLERIGKASYNEVCNSAQISRALDYFNANCVVSSH